MGAQSPTTPSPHLGVIEEPEDKGHPHFVIVECFKVELGM